MAIAVAAFVAAATPVWAQAPIQGRSADLGFTFQALGGGAWCQPTVTIQLDAPDRSAYERDWRLLEQALGRLRGAVTSQRECPRANAIKIEARADGETVYAAEMSRLARWIVVWYSPLTGLPDCLVGSSERNCAPAIRAYTLLQQTMTGREFADVQLTSFLDSEASAQAEFRARNLVGQVRIVTPADIDLPFIPPATVFTALVDRAATEECQQSGGTITLDRTRERTDDLVSVGFLCRGGSAAHAGHYFIFRTDNQLHIISTRSEVQARRNLTTFTDALAKQINTLRQRS